MFAGSATPRRERLLSDLVEFGLALWGPGWRKTSLRDYCRGEAPSTEEYLKAYAGATVAVNIHHALVENDPREASCNQRLFELAAMGAAQVVDDRGDLPRYFEAEREVAVFRDGAELQGPGSGTDRVARRSRTARPGGARAAAAGPHLHASHATASPRSAEK